MASESKAASADGSGRTHQDVLAELAQARREKEMQLRRQWIRPSSEQGEESPAVRLGSGPGGSREETVDDLLRMFPAMAEVPDIGGIVSTSDKKESSGHEDPAEEAATAAAASPPRKQQQEPAAAAAATGGWDEFMRLRLREMALAEETRRSRELRAAAMGELVLEEGGELVLPAGVQAGWMADTSGDQAAAAALGDGDHSATRFLQSEVGRPGFRHVMPGAMDAWSAPATAWAGREEEEEEDEEPRATDRRLDQEDDEDDEPYIPSFGDDDSPPAVRAADCPAEAPAAGGGMDRPRAPAVASAGALARRMLRRAARRAGAKRPKALGSAALHQLLAASRQQAELARMRKQSANGGGACDAPGSSALSQALQDLLGEGDDAEF